MTPRDFCYWLQGHLEISGARVLEEFEVQVIRDHLKLVFSKETPDRYTEDAINRELLSRFNIEEERRKMSKEWKDLESIPVCGAQPWMHEPNNELETLGHPIPPKFDTSADYDITPLMSWNTNVPMSC